MCGAHDCLDPAVIEAVVVTIELHGPGDADPSVHRSDRDPSLFEFDQPARWVGEIDGEAVPLAWEQIESSSHPCAELAGPYARGE